METILKTSLKKIRSETGIKQEYIAFIFKISQSYYSKLENGKIENFILEDKIIDFLEKF